MTYHDLRTTTIMTFEPLGKNTCPGCNRYLPVKLAKGGMFLDRNIFMYVHLICCWDTHELFSTVCSLPIPLHLSQCIAAE